MGNSFKDLLVNNMALTEMMRIFRTEVLRESQSKFAKRMGLSQTGYVHIEINKDEPMSKKNLDRFVQIFNDYHKSITS